MNTKREKLFQYAVLWHPKEEEGKDGKKTTVVQEIKTVLAVDEKSLMMKIIREIPEKYSDSLDQVDIVVRPF